jgi:preprotein translocase subunit SecE
MGASGQRRDPREGQVMATTADDDSNATPERLKAKSPFEFMRQVREEGRRVTWATRQEVTVSTIMVMIMVAAAAVFFFIVDAIIRWAIGLILPT